MSETPIQPALTPEQWEPCYVGAGYCGAELNASDYAITDGDAQRWTDGALTFNNEYDISRPHSLAALCLYQQPFGFTQEDVAFLRAVAEDASGWGYASTLAGKIAALLPPQP